MRSFRANKVENRFHEKQHFLSSELKKAIPKQTAVQPLSKDFITHEFPSYELLPRFARNLLRTFVLTVSAHPFWACKFTCHVIHRARALSTNMDNDRADGHCHSLQRINVCRLKHHQEGKISHKEDKLIPRSNT